MAKEKKVSDAIQLFETNLDKLKSEGGDVAQAEKLLEEAKLALNDEDYREALRLAMLSENEIEKADLQKKMAVEIISVTAAKLKDAEKKGIGVEEVRKQLMEAANALKNNDYVLALENAMESGMSLTEATEEYERALSTMHAAQARVNESDNIGVSVDKATELLNTAKEAFDKKDYTTAMKYAKETIRNAKHSYEDHLYKPIKNCEDLIATAQDLGVDVTRANNMLSEAKAALDEEAFSQVALFSQKCKRLIEREITKTLFEKLSNAKTRVNEAKGKGVDVAEAIVLLNIGESSLENKDYVEAASNFHKFEEALVFAETGKRPEPKKKTVEVVREVVEEEPVKEEAVEPEMDLGEFYADLDTRIHKISKIGISTKHAEQLMKKGRKLIESDPDKAKEIGFEADAELESAIESRSPNIVTEMDVGIINATEKIFDITLNLNNAGKSVAKDVKFEVKGKDFEVQGLEPLKILKANEKREIPLKIKALHGGALKLLINITFIRIFDQKQIGTQISEDINIKEKEKRKIEGPFEKYKAAETVKCYACNGKIKPGFMLIHCNCGNTYHDACGGRLGKCPMCGTEFKKKGSAKKKLALRVG